LTGSHRNRWSFPQAHPRKCGRDGPAAAWRISYRCQAEKATLRLRSL
jgi:hypothetical protein